MATERIRFRAAALWRLFLPVGVLAVVSVAIHREAWAVAHWTGYAAFGGTLVFLVAAHFLMQRYYYLDLTPEGLTIATLGRKRFFAWHDIAAVDFREREIDTAARAHVVLLKLRRASALQKIVGGDVSLLAVYELAPAEIAAKLRAQLEAA